MSPDIKLVKTGSFSVLGISGEADAKATKPEEIGSKFQGVSSNKNAFHSS
jgi:hypothetical protein